MNKYKYFSLWFEDCKWLDLLLDVGRHIWKMLQIFISELINTQVVWCRSYLKTYKTRTVRKSDYTPALALPKHMAGILDEKCREKEKYKEEQIGECLFSIPHYTCHCEPVYQI